jgi:hypothetical protein
MAKGIILTALLGLSVAVVGNPRGGDELKRACVTESYTSYIGVRERTGNNDGREVGLFLNSAGLKEGFAWCAAFATYVHKQCGVETPAKSPAWSPAWFPKNKIIDKETALRGDVFGLYYSNLKRIGHVGFIDEDWQNQGSTIITVEGNTNGDGSREGDGVYRKRRNKKQIYTISRWL